MKCSICDEKIDSCDECGDKFHKGEAVFCCSEGLGEPHECGECCILPEEGVVK